MGRSVSTPSNACAIAYQYLESVDYWDFQEWLEDIKARIAHIWPSFSPCDTWFDREDHAIMENHLTYIGISEYCGMTAIWIVPKTDNQSGRCIYALAKHFITRIQPKFMAEFNHYHRIGRFSNGESIFEKAI